MRNAGPPCPEFTGAFRVAGKPTARVLMERGDQVGVEGNIPLIATGRVGSWHSNLPWIPRNLEMATCGLTGPIFRSFLDPDRQVPDRNRSLQGSRRGFVDTDKTEYELGERIVFVSKILDEQFLPSTEESVTINITKDDGRSQKIEMQLLPGNTGQYQGIVVASRTGTFKGSIQIAGNESEELVEPITYRVVSPKVESGSFWLNEKLLKEIAARSGGNYIRIDEIGQLPEILPTRVQRVSFRSPAKPLWDWNQAFRFVLFAAGCFVDGRMGNSKVV